jgi:hypothetical protein
MPGGLAHPVLLLAEVLEHLVQDLLPETRVPGILGKLGKLDVLVDFLRPVDDDASQVKAPLVSVQILGGLDGEALLPEAVDVGLALLVGGPNVLDDLLELLETLQVLDEGVGTAVGLSEQRGDLRIEDLARPFDVADGVWVVALLDLEDGLVEALGEGVGGVRAAEDLYVLGEISPLAQIPGALEAVLGDLEQSLRAVARRLPRPLLPLELLLPHLANKAREILPVVEVLEALELTSLVLMVLRLVDELVGVDLERQIPLVPLLEPLSRLELVALLLLDHLVPHGGDEDALGRLWLAQAVVGRDDLLDGALRVILKLHLPVVEGLRIGVALLGDLCEGPLVEDLLLVFIELHELVEVQNRLEHRPWLNLAVDGVLDALHDLVLLDVVKNAPDAQEGHVVQL